MRRLLVLTASVIGGSLAAIGFFVATLRFRNPPVVGVLPRDELDILLFESTVLFYAVTFLIGQGIYRALGDRASAAIVRDQSEFQMAVFHLLAGVGLVALGVHALLRAKGDTAQVLAGLVGAILIATSLPTLRRRIGEGRAGR